MSTQINKYKISNELNPNFLQKIRSLFILADGFLNFSEEALIFTDDGNVFVLGNNSTGRLGLGHENAVKEPTILPELCGLIINKITYGFSHVIALTETGKIFCWGLNDCGKLGNGSKSKGLTKPQLNDYLSDETIVDISCGARHSLALTKTGFVYAWGWNKSGLVGNGSKFEVQLIPVKINGFNSEKIIQISCEKFHSLALSDKGHVYSWGFKQYKSLDNNYWKWLTKFFRVNKKMSSCPKRLLLEGNDIFITKISCGEDHSLLLSKGGTIYSSKIDLSNCKNIKYNNRENRFTRIESIDSFKFNDIEAHSCSTISAVLLKNNEFYVWKNCGKGIITSPQKTDANSFTEIFLNNNQLTNKMIYFRKYSVNLEVVENGKFKEEYESTSVVGWGQFSQVFKARNKSENEFCAIKKMNFTFDDQNRILREINLMSELDDKFIIQLKSGWIENKFNSTELLFHVEMELCNQSLKQLMPRIKYFASSEEILCKIGYYIRCELSIEFLEAVDYLHENNIIHRDLKPSNILITNGLNGRFIKISDFGLSKKIEFDDQSHTIGVGSLKYMAPEVMATKKYDTKADIYSAGVVMNEVFDLDIEKRVDSIMNLPQLTEKFNYLIDLTQRMTDILKKSRPDSKSVLNRKYLWALNISELEKSGDIQKFNQEILKRTGTDQDFCWVILRTKLKSQYISTNSTINLEDFKVYKRKRRNFSLSLNSLRLENLTLKEFNIVECSGIKPQSAISFENFSGKYKTEFDEFSIIGFGYFGIVCKAKTKFDNKFYAIKKISLNENHLKLITRELEIMTQLKSDFVVQYETSWVENNNITEEEYKSHEISNIKPKHMIFDNRNKLLHIQMELCTQTLRDTLKRLFLELNQKPFEVMSPIGYYISSELFIESLEGVNYLHKQNPPIIHRDLKPTNILITDGRNGRFVKLADFGLATLHEFEGQTHTKYMGTQRYTAPEVLRSTNYDTKADIYSLGVIVQELFNIDINSEINCESDPNLNRKYNNLFKIVHQMLSNQSTNRPDCYRLLQHRNKWALGLKNIELDIESKGRISEEIKFDDCFHLFFIHKKKINQKFNENNNNKTLFSNQLQNYKQNFIELSAIGSGNFSKIFKSRLKNDSKIVAIKKIPLNEELCEHVLKDMERINRLGEQILSYENFWVESNYLLKEKSKLVLGAKRKYSQLFHNTENPTQPLLLHIQMKLCYSSLERVIKTINNELNQSFLNSITPIGFYIASEIFIEILEAVNYLHKQNPPIIHCNLKPANIMIDFDRNDKIVKLSDAGLVALSDFDDQTSRSHLSGASKYIAPEIFRTKKYDQKSDIYSLGVIVGDLFNFDIYSTSLNHSNGTSISFFDEYRNIFELSHVMRSLIKEFRPNCEEILSDDIFKNVTLDNAVECQQFKESKRKFENFSKIEECFHLYFIQEKFRISKLSK